MIKSIARITLYVNSQEAAKSFWTEKMGFVVSQEQPMEQGATWLEVAPGPEAETVFVLYSKKMMETQNPLINVGTPSVILSTGDARKAREEMEGRGVRVGELMAMPYGCMFHFSDMDGNQFMVREE